MSDSGRVQRNVRERRADRRVLRTRQALVEAFSQLVLERPYDQISVRDILERAEVGRSTFYEHYRNKDDLLLESMEGLLAVLATGADQPDRVRLQHMLSHFWQNRRLARRLLEGPAGRVVSRSLTELVEARFKARPHSTLAVSPDLLAVQTAAAQLGLLRAWLAGEVRAPTGAVTAALALPLFPLP